MRSKKNGNIGTLWIVSFAVNVLICLICITLSITALYMESDYSALNYICICGLVSAVLSDTIIPLIFGLERNQKLLLILIGMPVNIITAAGICFIVFHIIITESGTIADILPDKWENIFYELCFDYMGVLGFIFNTVPFL